MDGLAWILGLFMGASIGIGLAFLICALILNKSNNKGDSRLKPEDYSSEIMSFSDKDNMRHNFNEFTYLIDCNIEAMCRSNEYTFRPSVPRNRSPATFLKPIKTARSSRQSMLIESRSSFRQIH